MSKSPKREYAELINDFVNELWLWCLDESAKCRLKTPPYENVEARKEFRKRTGNGSLFMEILNLKWQPENISFENLNVLDFWNKGTKKAEEMQVWLEKIRELNPYKLKEAK